MVIYYKNNSCSRRFDGGQGPILFINLQNWLWVRVVAGLGIKLAAGPREICAGSYSFSSILAQQGGLGLLVSGKPQAAVPSAWFCH
jgi:hypothetical protein